MQDENPLPAWVQKLQQPTVLFSGLGLVLILLLTVLWLAWRLGVAGDRYEMLEARAGEGFLQPPSSTRTIALDGRDRRRASVDGGGFPQRIDLLINAPSKRYALYRVSLVRADGTLVLHADRMTRDSNYDLRFSFNTSVLPNGEYRVRAEGYVRNGQLEPVVDAAIVVAGR